MIVDASALVAILLSEAEAAILETRLDAAAIRRTHPVSIWEATTAIARRKSISLADAELNVMAFLSEAEIAIVPLGEAEALAAMAAAARYGKGRGHPAQLNMGDCFSYGCAKVRRMPLLYKGDDFSRTDLA